MDIIGDGSLRKEVEMTAKQSGLEGRVRVHGFLERKEVERIRQRAAAQIVPSEWFENSPLTILEALSLGVPVIGSEAGGIPEIIDGNAGSMTFRSGDADALSRALVSLWDRRGALDILRSEARDAYQKRFSPDVHLKEYLRIVSSPDD